ncbi:MAG: hypothetical protein L3J71_10700 [Victivallaceae bacterium]|nr:hypothetical protein [Victivallaceae bacterium]
MACRKLQLQDYFRLIKPANNPTKYCGAGFTPQPVDGDGYHVGRVDNASFGTLDFTMLKNNSYTLQLVVQGGTDIVTAEVNFALNSQLKVGQLGFAQQYLIITVSE